MSININDHNARIARHIIVAGAHALLAHPDQVHYTMGSDRWEAISRRITIGGGHLLPFRSDCSSGASWLLWLALHHSFGIRDVVNGENWKGGWTGTMVKHGSAVPAFHSGRIGDCVFYGGTHDEPEHVAIKIAPGHVFSHGSEAGPFYLPINYRSDVHSEARRYFH